VPPPYRYTPFTCCGSIPPVQFYDRLRPCIPIFSAGLQGIPLAMHRRGYISCVGPWTKTGVFTCSNVLIDPFRLKSTSARSLALQSHPFASHYHSPQSGCASDVASYTSEISLYARPLFFHVAHHPPFFPLLQLCYCRPSHLLDCVPRRVRDGPLP